MSGRESILKWIAAISIVALTACTATVVGTRKIEGYSEKIKDVSIAWISPKQMKTRLTGRYAITEQDRDKSYQGVAELSRFLATRSVVRMTGTMSNKSVKVLSSDHLKNAKFSLSFEPQVAFSDCTAFGCAHDLGIDVSVVDVALKKEVWRGGFKVGAPFGTPLNDKLVDDFIDKVTNEMARADLI